MAHAATSSDACAVCLGSSDSTDSLIAPRRLCLYGCKNDCDCEANVHNSCAENWKAAQAEARRVEMRSAAVTDSLLSHVSHDEGQGYVDVRCIAALLFVLGAAFVYSYLAQ